MGTSLITYQGRALAFLPDHGVWKHRFEIGSDSSDRVYRVAFNKSSKTWGCSCPGWIRHRHCKHLTRLTDGGVFGQILKLGGGQ